MTANLVATHFGAEVKREEDGSLWIIEKGKPDSRLPIYEGSAFPKVGNVLMPDKSWKAFERRLAKRVGGKRIPVTGLDRAGADVVAGPFVYQAKLRRGLPSYLREWLRGIVAAGERKNAIGIVVWKAPREKDDDTIFLLRLKDWEEITRVGKKRNARPNQVERFF